MNEQSKRDALKKYFAPPPQPKNAIILLGLGLLSLFAFLSDPGDMGICGGIGFIMALAGGFWLYSLYGSKGSLPSDAEVDAWFQQDVANIVEKSLSKAGLDKTELVQAPIPVTGPIFWSTNGISGEDLRWKKGNDNFVRFSINRVTVILLSNQLMAAYACDFNFIKNVTLNESTQEYHYKDVVSVSTQEDSTSYTLPNGVSMVNSQAFKLSVASGENIKVVISAAKLSEITGGQIPTTSAEKAVQVIRTMLREKKQ
jgi:hypothetical protein